MNTPAIIYTHSVDDPTPRTVYGPFGSVIEAVEWASRVLGEETPERQWSTADLTPPMEAVLDINERLQAELAAARRFGFTGSTS